LSIILTLIFVEFSFLGFHDAVELKARQEKRKF